MLRIAVLASGHGSNLAAILEHCRAGRLRAQVAAVLSNNPQAGALEHARTAGVPRWALAHKGIAREDFDLRMLEFIRAQGAEAIILAGYMRLLTPAFIQGYAGRILNIHPALLPAFPGLDGGGDALAYGVKLAGCTVHFVDEIMDHGPVIIQAAVPVGAGDKPDDLMPRIHALEHRIYPQAVQWLADGRLSLDGRKVVLAPARGGELKPACCGEAEHGPWLVSPALEEF